jgi:hypothetical protein
MVKKSKASLGDPRSSRSIFYIISERKKERKKEKKNHLSDLLFVIK